MAQLAVQPSGVRHGALMPAERAPHEGPREARTDTDDAEIAAIRCQHAVDVPSLSYSDDCAVNEPQVERRESGVEFEGTNDVGGEG